MARKTFNSLTINLYIVRKSMVIGGGLIKEEMGEIRLNT